MKIFIACVAKELLLLRRDLHGVLLLFAMPMVFILIMSLALQNEFAARAGSKLSVLAIDRDHSDLSRDLLSHLSGSGAFAVTESASDVDATQLQTQMRNSGHAFAIIVPHDFGAQTSNTLLSAREITPITAIIAPDTSKQIELIFIATLREAQGRLRVAEFLKSATIPNLGGETKTDVNTDIQTVSVLYAYAAHDIGQAPSAVQQSVPAWLVFSVFFVAIPLSNTLIRERQLGTLRRLRSTNASGFVILASKWVTFFCVNQLQIVVMLLAGVYLVPALGGEALVLNGSKPALLLISAALSVAALGYALLLAVIAKTTEQATMLGGAGNIILAAIGGIMVPKFVMPAALQHLSNISPMAWGLEGFLDVLLRNGHAIDVLPRASELIAFGLVTLMLAVWVQQHRAE